VPIIGVCVRRSADLQADRIQKRASQIASLLGFDDLIKDADVIVRDDVLAPGYGTLNDAVANAIDVAARREALLLDPVYSGRTLAGLIEGLAAGIVQPGASVLMIHTGGNTSIFAYHNKLAEVIDRITPIGLSSHNSAPEGAG
jgi:D-cysteine desulfhydrase/L-cysteate sulfo-lyase